VTNKLVDRATAAGVAVQDLPADEEAKAMLADITRAGERIEEIGFELDLIADRAVRAAVEEVTTAVMVRWLEAIEPAKHTRTVTSSEALTEARRAVYLHSEAISNFTKAARAEIGVGGVRAQEHRSPPWCRSAEPNRRMN
jgi:Xaa-Pro aminopeptidase